MALANSPIYAPTPIAVQMQSEDGKFLQKYLQQQFQNISISLQQTTANVFVPISAAPTRPTAGMVIYADGANWDPGNGAGLYEYTGTFWIPLFGGLTNRRISKSGNYTVVNGDYGATIALNGNAFFTLTFSAASGYSPNFMVLVVNEDPDPPSGRAKWISISGGTSFYLWPRQSALVFAQNNVWHQLGKTRYKPPNAITLNTDFVNGTDASGGTDGLSTSTGALKTVNNAMLTILGEFDFSENLNVATTVVTILMAAGTTDTQQVHASYHGFVGAFGRNAVKIDGNGATLSSASAGTLQLFLNTTVQLRNITIGNTGGGNGIEVHEGARIDILDLVTFAAASGGAQIYVVDQGQLVFNNNFTISGGALFFILSDVGEIRSLALTATVSANITYIGQVVNSQNPGTVQIGNFTWSLGGHTVTGQRFSVSKNSVIDTGGKGINFIPGTVAGSQASGGQYI